MFHIIVFYILSDEAVQLYIYCTLYVLYNINYVHGCKYLNSEDYQIKSDRNINIVFTNL